MESVWWPVWLLIAFQCVQLTTAEQAHYKHSKETPKNRQSQTNTEEHAWPTLIFLVPMCSSSFSCLFWEAGPKKGGYTWAAEGREHVMVSEPNKPAPYFIHVYVSITISLLHWRVRSAHRRVQRLKRRWALELMVPFQTSDGRLKDHININSYSRTKLITVRISRKHKYLHSVISAPRVW